MNTPEPYGDTFATIILNTTPPSFIAVDTNGCTIATANAEEDHAAAFINAARNILNPHNDTEDTTTPENPTPTLNPTDYSTPAPGDRNPTNPEIRVLATHPTSIDPEAFNTWWDTIHPNTPAPDPYNDPTAVGHYLTATQQD